MRYHVTFQLAGTQQTEEVDAPDAATAVSKTQFDYGRGDELFELISVQVAEEQPAEEPAEEPEKSADPA